MPTNPNEPCLYDKYHPELLQENVKHLQAKLRRSLVPGQAFSTLQQGGKRIAEILQFLGDDIDQLLHLTH
jgi:hypothetical protein